MKLRTRITWICCLAALLAMISANLLIWTAQRESLKQEAQTRAYQNADMYFDACREQFQIYNNLAEEISDDQLRYFMKSLGSDYIVCVRYDDSVPTYLRKDSAYFVFNHTVFTINDLRSVKYTFQTYDIESAEFTYEGGHYIISKTESNYNMVLYYIEDINYVWEKLDRLTIFMVIVTVLVLIGMSFLVFLVLRHTLKSLQKLDATAEEIANGNYEKRVTIHGHDEIAKLSETFNRMAEAVLIRTRTLEDSEREKTMFMANLTHELKTPLAAISGYAQTLLTVQLDDADREEALVLIDEESKRIARLSKKMMRLLELDSEVELERHDVPAKDLFDKTKTLCNGMISSKNLALVCECGEETFFVDEDLMLEVLVNLTENAAKASGPGQTIRLLAKEHCIEVCDDGCGIPADEQEKILEPFYMIDKSRSRKNGGAGLGLALTVLILKQHGITLCIESEVGKGTRMILQFV